MIIELVVKNMKNSFRNFQKIYLLLIVSQLISIVSIFLVYGIYGSFSAKMKELDVNSYIIGTYFEESNIGELKSCMPEILDKIGNKIDYVFIAGGSKQGMISMYTEYHGGKYTLAEIQKEKNLLKEGRTLRYVDAENTEKVAYSQFTEEHSVGDTIDIEGTQFEIVGVDERSVNDIIIPFNSCPDTVRLSMVFFNFKRLPSEKDYYVMKDTFENTFQERVVIDEFALKDQEEIISYRTIIIISIAIGIISALNTCLLYGYIVTQRRKQMVVYGIIGATKEKRLMINELEIMLVNSIVVIIGFVIFRLGLQKWITTIYENSVELYNTKAYLIMMIIYVLCIFVFTILLLAVMNQEKLIDMLRRTKND